MFCGCVAFSTCAHTLCVFASQCIFAVGRRDRSRRWVVVPALQRAPGPRCVPSNVVGFIFAISGGTQPPLPLPPRGSTPAAGQPLLTLRQRARTRRRVVHDGERVRGVNERDALGEVVGDDRRRVPRVAAVRRVHEPRVYATITTTSTPAASTGKPTHSSRGEWQRLPHAPNSSGGA